MRCVQVREPAALASQPELVSTQCIALRYLGGEVRGEQCKNMTASGSQFCYVHKGCQHSCRAGKPKLSLLTAIQEGKFGGPLLDVVLIDGSKHVHAKQELFPKDIVTSISGRHI
jgi:hypothetical protein